MLVKTATLTGDALDWMVREALLKTLGQPALGLLVHQVGYGHAPDPYSTDRSRGQPIVEQAQIDVVRCNDLYFPKGNESGDYYEQYWRAEIKGAAEDGALLKEYGPTPLVAAMRCFVASKLGPAVEVPDELAPKTPKAAGGLSM